MSKDHRKALDFFAEGKELEKRGKLAEALSSYKTAVALDETLSQAWFHQFKVHLLLGHDEEAQDCAKRAVDLDPKWTGFIAKVQKEEEKRRLRDEKLRQEEASRPKSSEELFIEDVVQMALNLDTPTPPETPSREVHDLFYKAKDLERSGQTDEALELYAPSD